MMTQSRSKLFNCVEFPTSKLAGSSHRRNCWNIKRSAQRVSGYEQCRSSSNVGHRLLSPDMVTIDVNEKDLIFYLKPFNSYLSVFLLTMVVSSPLSLGSDKLNKICCYVSNLVKLKL